MVESELVILEEKVKVGGVVFEEMEVKIVVI